MGSGSAALGLMYANNVGSIGTHYSRGECVVGGGGGGKGLYS